MNTSQPDPRAYMKLAALIRDQIASGELAPGERLSIRVLCGKTGHCSIRCAGCGREQRPEVDMSAPRSFPEVRSLDRDPGGTGK